MIYCGIDPGISGGLAFYKEGELFRCFDMPSKKKPKGKGNMVCSKSLYDLLLEFNPDHTTLEWVWARPSDGGSSGFNFGMNFMACISTLEISGLPFELVAPSVWMKHFQVSSKKGGGLTASDLVKAQYPDAEIYGPRGGVKDGRCDAVLLALYGGCRSHPGDLREHKGR